MVCCPGTVTETGPDIRKMNIQDVCVSPELLIHCNTCLYSRPYRSLEIHVDIQDAGSSLIISLLQWM